MRARTWPSSLPDAACMARSVTDRSNVRSAGEQPHHDDQQHQRDQHQRHPERGMPGHDGSSSACLARCSSRMPLPSAPSSSTATRVGQQQHHRHHHHRLGDEPEAGQPQFDAVPPTQDARSSATTTYESSTDDVRSTPADDAPARVDAEVPAQSMMSAWFCSTAGPHDETSESDHVPEAPYTVTAPVPYAPGGPLRNPFPPIADYGFLSDCENTCLISSAGSVEWMCVPRPDSPSVFGAILDRGAGHFRLAPVRRDGARRPPLPAGQPDHGDHLADPHRLADRARRPGDGARGTTSTPGRGRTAAPRWTGTPSTSCCAPCAASAASSNW